MITNLVDWKESTFECINYTIVQFSWRIISLALARIYESLLDAGVAVVGDKNVATL